MTTQIDEAVLSRQLYTIGKDAQMKIMRTRVLVNGLNGLGAEIAKNIILMSVKSVGLLDNRQATIEDLGTNFFLRSEHIGKKISESTVSSFQELNTSLKVSVESRQILDESIYSDYDVIVDTEFHAKKDVIQIDELCRKHSVKYVHAINRGCFSMIFNDFGDEFVVYDINGEAPKTFVISSLFENTFQLTEDAFCDLQEGDMIKFEEVVGLEELNFSTNGNKTFKITKRTGCTIEIGDLKEISKGNYVKGGIITEVKQPITLKMKSLKERLTDAGEIAFTNSSKFDRLWGTHGMFHALMVYLERFGETPKTHDEEDFEKFKKIVTELNVEIDENVMKMFCYGNNGYFSPLDTTIGGIAAQEVLKAASGKYTPYNQFMVYDCTEILPEKYLEMNKDEFVDNGRYAGQIALIGKTVQKQLADSSMFLVGSGAIGCEVLKTWAMMGIATGNGVIHVTDNDCIEKSNLSRQFLFRNQNVGQSKSQTAANAVKLMNPEIHIVDYTLRVGPATENVFNRAFYQKLNAITTALDNVQARNYVDSQCLKYKLPMIEAGTTGTKGNTQTIVPFLTQSYSTGSIRDEAEKSIPMCTLHNFPNNIDHTIQWARDRFEGWFKREVEPVKMFKEQGEKYLETQKNQSINILDQTLDLIIENGVRNVPKTTKECVQWARAKYDVNYCNEIQALIDMNPEDSVTSDGIPFWHAPKRFPHVVPFNKENPVAREFVINGTHLIASVYGVKIDMSDEEIVEYSQTLSAVPYVSKKVVMDQEEKEMKEEEIETAEDFLEEIRVKQEEVMKAVIETVYPVEFEKDDDTNHHIAFITAASNLRAENYCIEPADFMKTKMIAGKIIPAMITTTAVVSGLQCVEFIKVIQKKPFECYYNSYLNLAIGYMDGTEPEPVIKTQVCEGVVTTIWDTFEFDVSRDITPQQLIDIFDAKYPYHLESFNHKGKLLYAEFLPKSDEKLNVKICDLWKKMTEKEFDSDNMELVVTVTSKDEDVELDYDFEFPNIVLNFF